MRDDVVFMTPEEKRRKAKRRRRTNEEKARPKTAKEPIAKKSKSR